MSYNWQHHHCDAEKTIPINGNTSQMNDDNNNDNKVIFPLKIMTLVIFVCSCCIQMSYYKNEYNVAILKVGHAIYYSMLFNYNNTHLIGPNLRGNGAKTIRIITPEEYLITTL